MHDPLVYFGSPVKVLKVHTREDGMEVATLGGHLVVFSGPDSPDLEGDFFTRETDFGTLSRKGTATLPAYYQHGFDPHFSNKALGDAEVRFDEFGVWAEYQLELRTQYERHLLEMAQQGKLGQSSGAVAHLVERKAAGKTGWLKVWPLGEASLTPTPAEPRTSAVPLKSLFPEAFQAAEPAPAEPAPAPTPALAPATAKIVAAVEPTGNLVFAARKAASPEQSTVAAPDPAAPPEPTTNQPQKTATMSDQSKETAQAAVPNEPTPAPQIVGVTKAELDEALKQLREDMKPGAPTALNVPGAPSILTNGRGDNEAKALVSWLRTGDTGGVKHLVGENDAGQQFLTLGADPGTGEMTPAYKNWKASNATDMNIGTDADGGYAVPTGHLDQIITRRDETMITRALGCRLIPGVGTTVNVPLDNEDDGEFVETAETVASDLDAPALGQKPFTLKVYTKQLDLSYELLRDETSGVLSYIAEHVGRGMAKTHNNLLLTEVAANGTSFKTFGSATAIQAGEPEDIEANDDLGAYLDDASVAWVMRNSTLSVIRKITGNDRLYADDATGGPNVRDRRQLLGYDVFRSNKAASIAASAKSVYFGNWFYVGYRAPDGMQFLRDPFSKAVNRQIRLHYYFSTVYGVLQAEAIGYGQHPTG